MLNLVRKSLLITAMICFLAMVTGLALTYHLFIQNHLDKHHAENCSICQILLSNIDKISITNEEPKIEKANNTEYILDLVRQFVPSPLNITHLGPRSPPLTR